jgi:chromate transporter
VKAKPKSFSHAAVFTQRKECAASPSDAPEQPGRAAEVFRVFLKLGCTSFGGPIAHFGYFQNEFVARRKWIDQETYADLVALCQFLPGPASSQVGLALGWRRAGWRGSVAAWLGFTLPSAVLMAALAYSLRSVGNLAHAGWVQGLKVAAVAVVAQAVVMMARKLCPDWPRAAIAAGAAGILTLFATSGMQLAVIVAGAAAGVGCSRWFSGEPAIRSRPPSGRRRDGLVCLGLFLGLLLALPWLARVWPMPALRVFDGFYRAGALVFGGGHVVLPLLQQATVARGWLSQDTFLAGYGAAQALPGPLFAFSAYLGVIIAPGGIGGALLALVAIYLPAVLVLFAALPYWERLRRLPWARHLLAGANAAVVGLLAAALYSPLGTTTITEPKRFALALAAFAALQIWRTPPWIIVVACAGIGAVCFG